MELMQQCLPFAAGIKVLKLVFIIKREKILIKKNLDSLHGLRIFAFYSLFAFHAGYNVIPTDVGARTVEFFFIMSGFLMA